MFLENLFLMMQKNNSKVVLKLFLKAGMGKKLFHIAGLKVFLMTGVQP
jgi:hypothetical protein